MVAKRSWKLNNFYFVSTEKDYSPHEKLHVRQSSDILYLSLTTTHFWSFLRGNLLYVWYKEILCFRKTDTVQQVIDG